MVQTSSSIEAPRIIDKKEIVIDSVWSQILYVAILFVAIGLSVIVAFYFIFLCIYYTDVNLRSDPDFTVLSGVFILLLILAIEFILIAKRFPTKMLVTPLYQSRHSIWRMRLVMDDHGVYSQMSWGIFTGPFIFTPWDHVRVKKIDDDKKTIALRLNSIRAKIVDKDNFVLIKNILADHIKGHEKDGEISKRSRVKVTNPKFNYTLLILFIAASIIGYVVIAGYFESVSYNNPPNDRHCDIDGSPTTYYYANTDSMGTVTILHDYCAFHCYLLIAIHPLKFYSTSNNIDSGNLVIQLVIFYVAITLFFIVCMCMPKPYYKYTALMTATTERKPVESQLSNAGVDHSIKDKNGPTQMTAKPDGGGTPIETLDMKVEKQDESVAFIHINADGTLTESEMSHNNAMKSLDAQAATTAGIMREREGDWVKAIEYHRKAIDSAPTGDPNLAAYHTNLGVCLANVGKVQEAIHELETAVRLNPEYRRAHTNLDAAKDLLK
jgi:hypothetical protein